MPPKTARVGRTKSVAAPSDPMADLTAVAPVHATLAAAERQRNYFQVERDKVQAYWDLARREVANQQDALLNAEASLEEMERAHQVEMKVYKQKVRHLLYEHKMKVKSCKEESDRMLKEAEEKHQKRMNNIRTLMQQHTKQLETGAENYEMKIEEQRDSHNYMVTATKKQSHEKELARQQAAYDAKLKALRDELELRRRAEIHEIEERKNEHINALIQQHEAKFQEMKAYYNQITTNNLEIIQSLKEEIAQMKKNDEHNETLMYDIDRENQNLVAPLEEAQREVAELQQKRKQYEQDKRSLGMTRAKLRSLREEIWRLREEHKALEERYSRVHQEREELKSKFESALRQAMEVVEERNEVLQQRLIESHALVEERDAQLDGVLNAMHLEPAALDLIATEVDRTLERKNQMIKDLHFELKKGEKLLNATLVELERRCQAVNLPPLPRDTFF
ncbi:T-lymphocyte triggering factor [Trypanosoma theileri]|uniref:T-lymphocyte triggering factor n=1 Tax=Trypanosoma theileri TaxID=67003 RepID=A0A1X0P7Y2_9TRYP|nr:T-lymphocyte triggering factor [Trypanosoma theileri]ORC92988.1 T-lymphocyte triggering factor [Trypanosoma theileri]